MCTNDCVFMNTASISMHTLVCYTAVLMVDRMWLSAVMFSRHSNCCLCVFYVQAISGQAVDRHLLGLNLQARESGIELPDIFKDPAYNKSMHFNLSTSQVCVIFTLWWRVRVRVQSVHLPGVCYINIVMEVSCCSTYSLCMYCKIFFCKFGMISIMAVCPHVILPYIINFTVYNNIVSVWCQLTMFTHPFWVNQYSYMY